jgi:hypothetical protein
MKTNITAYFLIFVGIVMIAVGAALPYFSRQIAGTKSVGTFDVKGVTTEVFDVKTNDRSCMVFVSKFENVPQPQFYFSCPQER